MLKVTMLSVLKLAFMPSADREFKKVGVRDQHTAASAEQKTVH